MQLLLIVAIVACTAFALFVARSRALRVYLSRACQGSAWKRAFPQARARDIRAFLDTFVGAFAFSNSHRLKFSPADGIMDIYRASNPGGLVDALELESFAVALERRYKFSLKQSWRPGLTLGELFALVRGYAP